MRTVAVGRFNFEVPDDSRFTRPLGRRVRATVVAVTKIDTDEAHVVWATGSLPRYTFPAGDVHVPGSQRSTAT